MSWPDAERLAELMAADPDLPSPNGCPCDFCTRKKKYADNWCFYCAQVKMPPPKNWGNGDVCEECEVRPREKYEFYSWYETEHNSLHKEWSAAVGTPGYEESFWLNREHQLNERARRYANELDIEPPYLLSPTGRRVEIEK